MKEGRIVTRENAAQFQRGIFSLCCQIGDCKVLRRVWKILDRAFEAQAIAGNNGSTAESQERQALIGDISGRLMNMDVEQLRRVDWYMGRIGA